jgi:hypothetical protein
MATDKRRIISDVIRQGFLTRTIRGQSAAKISWFVLRPTKLELYAHTWARHPQRVISLSSLTQINPQHIKLNDHEIQTSFHLLRNKKEMTVIAQTQIEMHEWIEAILKAKVT